MTTLTTDEAAVLAFLGRHPRHLASGPEIGRALDWPPSRVHRIVRRLKTMPLRRKIVACFGVGYKLEENR